MNPQAAGAVADLVAFAFAIVLTFIVMAWQAQGASLQPCICGHKTAEHVKKFDYDALDRIAGGTRPVDSCRQCRCRCYVESPKYTA